jgi:lipid II:glycine glycyltransferase (peptidoglycan interpeptide bridge formation enzyme)
LFNDKKEEIQLNINDIFNIINLCIELNGSDAVKNRVVMDMLPSSKRKEAKKTLEEFDNRMKWFINNKTESDEMVITGDTNVVLLKEKLGMINEIKDN